MGRESKLKRAIREMTGEIDDLVVMRNNLNRKIEDKEATIETLKKINNGKD